LIVCAGKQWQKVLSRLFALPLSFLHSYSFCQQPFAIAYASHSLSRAHFSSLSLGSKGFFSLLTCDACVRVAGKTKAIVISNSLVHTHVVFVCQTHALLIPATVRCDQNSGANFRHTEIIRQNLYLLFAFQPLGINQPF
jgi:hypothetical protein